MSLFVSCGEVSGDLYAAGLVRALLRRRPALRGRIWGMMGPRTEEACGEFAPERLKGCGNRHEPRRLVTTTKVALLERRKA